MRATQHHDRLVFLCLALAVCQSYCSQPVGFSEDGDRDAAVDGTHLDTGSDLESDPDTFSDPTKWRDGQPCVSNDQCLSGTCLSESDGFPGGMCTSIDCEQDVDCRGVDAVCVRGEVNGNLCLPACSTSGSCRAGYRCVPSETYRYCSPDPIAQALDPDCASQIVQYEIRPDPDYGLVDRHRTHFTIADGSIGLSVTITTDGDRLHAQTLTAPSGEVLDLGDEYRYFMLTGDRLERISPLTIPAGPQWVDWVQGGLYTLDVVTDGSRICTVTLNSQCLGDHLDLNLYFVGTLGLNAANASSHPHMERVLDQLDWILEPVDIRLGTLRYYDVTGDVVDRFSIIRTSNDALDLMRLGRPPGPSVDTLLSLDVYLVRGFSGELASALGVSPGIPGVIGLHGEVGTGVILSTANMGIQDGDRLVGQVLAHELGHFLGLEHTTEIERPDRFDHLADTPQCNGLQTETLQSCPDFDNLMFPIAACRDAIEVTADQALVMRSNPLVKCESP